MKLGTAWTAMTVRLNALCWYHSDRYDGTASCATLVPLRPLRWFGFECYDGTVVTAAMVPLRALCWYRLTDTINKRRRADLSALLLHLYDKYIILPTHPFKGMSHFTDRLS